MSEETGRAFASDDAFRLRESFRVDHGELQPVETQPLAFTPSSEATGILLIPGEGAIAPRNSQTCSLKWDVVIRRLLQETAPPIGMVAWLHEHAVAPLEHPHGRPGNDGSQEAWLA